MTPDFDSLLTDPAFFADPSPAYAALRRTAPVYWSAAWRGWVLTRYADIAAVFRDPARFSSVGRVGYLLDQLPPALQAQAAPLYRHYAVGLAHADPPDHTRLRAILNRHFTPRRLERLRPRIRGLVDFLLTQAAETGRMDLIAGLAYPLPAIVVLELLGAPGEDRELFRGWALGVNALFAKGGQTDAQGVAAALAALAEMRAYLLELFAARRRQPADDLISLLLHAGEEERLSEQELVSTCVTLFVAGHETTTNTLGNGVLALLRQRREWERLAAQPSLAETAVEELLRYDTPVQRGWRLAKEAAVIRGVEIPAGSLLLPMLGAANRDPHAFPDPDRLEITRQSDRHLGFGVGIHFCLGAPLARMELTEALTQLATRFPGLRLDESAPLHWRPDIALRGVEALWVEG